MSCTAEARERKPRIGLSNDQFSIVKRHMDPKCFT
jgi:hypothetical protein